MSYYKRNEDYYDIRDLLKYDCDRTIAFGERSAGKTTSTLGYCLEHFVKTGYNGETAYVRQLESDIKGNTGSLVFANLVSLGWVEEITNGKYNNIYFRAQNWYLANQKRNGELTDKMKEPFCRGFAINLSQRYKGNQFPYVDIIYHDEFMLRNGRYITNEFDLYQDILATIIRRRDDIKIIETANSVDYNSIYWHKWGIYEKVKYMIPGDVEKFEFIEGKNRLTTIVEYTDPPVKGKPSDKYFISNASSSKMITEGQWETGDYNILPNEDGDPFRPHDVIFRFYIEVYDELFEGNVILKPDNNEYYLYIFRRKNTYGIDFDRDLIYSTTPHTKNNYKNDILKPNCKPSIKIAQFFKEDNVFYEDRFVGEMINTYLNYFRDK